MTRIKVMDDILANKIAAGEVVEKCASVVKELVENSIDAGSTEIKIELIDAGTKEIKVTDNGVGIAHEDAILAFERHATSKLVEEEDLYHIETLGFRGEALASIASVSQVTLKTSTGGVGTVVTIHGGHLIDVTAGDARVGTMMCVQNLFYNTPARLKHLKSLYAELANASEYVNKMALSHPEIKFVFQNNDTLLLNTDGSGDLLKTIKNIYGLEVVKKMIPVRGENDDYLVEGFISLPEVHRSNRNHMVTLVDGRVVRNAELNRIINDSYHSFKPDNRYPIVVLNITVDPSLIDVNIHPTKMDIKFSKMDMLAELISSMMKEKLHQKNLIPKIEVAEEVVETVRPVYQEMTLDLTREVHEEKIPYIKGYPQVDMAPNVEDMLDVTPLEKEIIYEEDIIEKKDRLPELYPVGLIHGTYIICQNETGMYLIDQHAAKERVNYEMYKEKLGNPNSGSTAMLFPITIELTSSEFIIVKENFNFLRGLQFEIDEFGMNSIIMKRHPNWIPVGQEEDAIRRILEVVIACEKDFTIEKFNERVATMLSCKMAIKANESITMLEMEHLVNDLRNCDNPFNCPHGRPTIIFYSNYELEKLFKRSGF